MHVLSARICSVWNNTSRPIQTEALPSMYESRRWRTRIAKVFHGFVKLPLLSNHNAVASVWMDQPLHRCMNIYLKQSSNKSIVSFTFSSEIILILFWEKIGRYKLKHIPERNMRTQINSSRNMSCLFGALSSDRMRVLARMLPKVACLLRSSVVTRSHRHSFHFSRRSIHCSLEWMHTIY